METRISQQSRRVHPENKRGEGWAWQTEGLVTRLGLPATGGRGRWMIRRSLRRRWNDAQTFGPKFSWWFSGRGVIQHLRSKVTPGKKPSATFNKSPPRCVLPPRSPSVSPWLSRWEWNLKGKDTVSNLLCSHPPSGPPRVLFDWHHCTETWQANLNPPTNPLPFPSARFLPRWCHTPYGFQQHQAGKEI